MNHSGSFPKGVISECNTKTRRKRPCPWSRGTKQSQSTCRFSCFALSSLHQHQMYKIFNVSWQFAVYISLGVSMASMHWLLMSCLWMHAHALKKKKHGRKSLQCITKNMLRLRLHATCEQMDWDGPDPAVPFQQCAKKISLVKSRRVVTIVKLGWSVSLGTCLYFWCCARLAQQTAAAAIANRQSVHLTRPQFRRWGHGLFGDVSRHSSLIAESDLSR